MAFVEFSITDKTFFNAQRQWREDGKTEAEVSALTSILLQDSAKSREAAMREAVATGQPIQLGKFPPWLRKFITEKVNAASKGAKLKWDSENDTYRVRLPLELPEVEDWLSGDFMTEYTKLVGDHTDWSENCQLHCSTSESDGTLEMADLEGHSRGAPLHPSRTGKKKDDHVEELPA